MTEEQTEQKKEDRNEREWLSAICSQLCPGTLLQLEYTVAHHYPRSDTAITNNTSLFEILRGRTSDEPH